jgi:hypothetical protein
MAQVIAPLIPVLSPQAEAMAGSQALIFTATDRQIIKERSGEINHHRSFKEIFAKDLTPRVENEESTVKPEQDLKLLESRRREHQHILKHSSVIAPKEQVEILQGEVSAQMLQESLSASAVIIKEQPPEVNLESKIAQKTATIAKELNLNPAEIFDKFFLEQEALYNLIYRIKELHLKRLLTTNHEEFIKVSEEIKKETLAKAHPQARQWLEEQLDKLTADAIDYKASLKKSMRAIGLCESGE